MAKLGRLTRGLVLEVKSKGRPSKAFSGLFSVKMAKLDQLPPNTSSFAVVVPAKVFKTAVARNKIKRRIRANLNILKEQLRPGYGVIFFCQAKIKEASPSELFKELNKTLYDLLIV